MLKPHSSTEFGFSYRLHYVSEFRRFFSSAEVFRLRDCTVFRVPNREGHFRLGITLKVRARSVDRNRVKRTVRETFRSNAQLLGDYDYNVVISGGRSLSFPYSERLGACLRAELMAALHRRRTTD